MSTQEIFETLELPNTTTARFRDDDEYKTRPPASNLIYYTLLSIEIESNLPPTDCVFTLSFYTHQSTSVQTIKLHSMEYRQVFIFENGFYILYLDSIKIFRDDIPKDLIPIDFKFTNKRDIKSLARLFYKVTFGE